MTDHTDIPITETHHCSCGEQDDGLPELDVRTIPHAIRPGSVIGAFSQVAPGSAMVIVAPHNPLPLLNQLQQINGDSLAVSYLQEGPDAWKVKLARLA
ncbi:MAG: DUF2249 domain-containing protein [Acidipropionibacterium jensenii]|nr:DUF2249 domain-containing protein [Acidipropionibacterium jensenii]